MSVYQINNPKDLNEFLNSQPVSVLKVYANWCGSCKTYGPKYKQLAQKYGNTKGLEFAESDVDKKIIKVSALPTTLIVKNGRIVDKVVGGNIQDIEEMIRKHA